MRGRRTVRRTARRTSRRTGRRVVRRRRRRRILVGGMVLLTVGGAAAAAYGAVKLSQKDVEQIEQHTGAKAEELTEEELVAAMQELGIQSIELDDNDKAAITKETGEAPPAAPAAPAPAAAPPAAPAAPEESYLDELEHLAGLRDKGIISDEDFEAKKKQLLGL